MTNLNNTRRALHAIAELLIAGPQYISAGNIRLRARPGGFGGWTDPATAVSGTVLVTSTGRFPIRGTLTDLANDAGIIPRALRDVYSDGPDLAVDEPLDVTAEAAQLLLRAFTDGDAALRAFAPDQEPILWPEHFDIGISAGEINYGVSPGDSTIGEPYAYVGPWHLPSGSFWNQSFGAARTLVELPTAQDIRGFFEDGKTASAQ